MHLIDEAYVKGLTTGVLDRDTFIGKKIDDYLLVRKLGEGGFGAVYLAFQMPIMMKTALKVLKTVGMASDAQERVKSFQIEAQALAQLSHPNVVRLVKYGVIDGIPYMAMEFVKNGTGLDVAVKTRAAAGTAFTFAETRHIMTQVLHALAAAHEDHLIHRDLKPQNIMLQRVKGDPLFVRVLDFGLAKFVAHSKDTSMARGTPAYMAPEQFLGKNIGSWTDLYAAGLILFELLVGHPAFAEGFSSELVARKLDLEHDPTVGVENVDLPEIVQEFIRKASSPEAEKRFQTAQEFLTAMEAVFSRLEPSGREGLYSDYVEGIGFDATMASDVQDPEFGTHETLSAARTVTDTDADGRPVRMAADFRPESQATTRESLRGTGRVPWLAILVAAVVGALLFAGGYFVVNRFVLTSGQPAVADLVADEAGLDDRELAVNTFTEHRQQWPWIDTFDDGRFVAVWQSDHQDGSGSGIFAQFFNADATQSGDEFQVNTHTAGHQAMPKAASLSDGGVVIVWAGEFQDGDGWGVFGQRYDKKGRKQRATFPVNNYTGGDQVMAFVEVFSDDRFVVVWQSYGQDGEEYGIFGQVFDSRASRIGSEFQVNSVTEGKQRFPSVAAYGRDDYVVVWESSTESRYDVFAQRFDPKGKRVGEQFQVNSYIRGGQRWPIVESMGRKGYVVMWTSEGQDGSGRGIYGQLYAADGTRKGEEFPVNTTSAGHQWLPHVAVYPDGRFVALWMGEGQDESGFGAFGQAYNSDGTLLGEEFQVNIFESGDQRAQALAAFPDSRFIAVWESEGQDGSGWGIFARIATLKEDGTIE